MQTSNSQTPVRLAYAALALTVLLWAGAFPATRLALLSMTPEHLMVTRFTLATLALLIWAARCKVRFPKREDLVVLIPLGLITGFAYQMAFNHGMRSVSSGPAAAIIDTAPIFAAILGALWLNEKLGGVGWVGMLAGLGGVVMIAFGERGEWVFEPGTLLLLVAALLFAVSAVMQKPLLLRYRVVDISVWILVLGTLPMLVFWPGAVSELINAPRDVIVSVIFLALFPAALGSVLWNYALTHLLVAQVSSALYLLPPVAFLIAWIWLDETPAAISIAGALLTLAGVALVQIPLLSARRAGRAGLAARTQAESDQRIN